MSQSDEILFQRYLDGQLDADELAALDIRIRDDESFRRNLADWLHQEGVLRAEAHDLFSDSEEIDAERSVIPFRMGTRVAAAAALVAAGLALGWLGSLGKEIDAPVIVATAEPVATLADIKSAKWGAGSLPTQEGARLLPGQFELLEGLATVRFDSGATVTLEAPASLEIASAMRCRLINGAAVAWVPEGAQGFQIETDDALLTDYGTRFGVTAGTDGKSEVLVLEGEVGVTHHKGDGEKRLTTGEMVRYDQDSLLETLAGGEGETIRFGKSVEVEDEGWTSITTADGRGKDTCVRQSFDNSPLGDSPLLMVKNSSEWVGNRRKAWLTFDLSSVDKASIAESELVLSIQQSGLGYASVVPDATFAVYGMTDQSSDATWDEASMVWADAPANVLDHGFQLDESRVTLLGEFVVEQGVSSGLRTVSGPAMTDFLLSDIDGLATFIVVRLTDETDRHGLVHAFASAEHPVAMPPTLRVRRK